MKQLYFISTGRCGTKRLMEILKEVLPEEDFAVQHQMGVSRLANVFGNLMFYFGHVEWISKWIRNRILKKYATKKYFICTDPLVAMIYTKSMLKDKDIYFVHVTREKKTFAKSFFNLSRARRNSLIAHNFIPFWQPGVWPLENLLNNDILGKYESVWVIKNKWFKATYENSAYFKSIKMEDLFQTNELEKVIVEVFEIHKNIPKRLIEVKSN